MIVLDVLAAFAIAFGAFLGARRGFWRIATGSGAVALGTAAGWALVDVLAEALMDIGVGHTGSRILGFFLPFAVVSVYARFLAGLWLVKLLEDQPDRNRTLGAAAGAVWMVFVAGLVCRIAGLQTPPVKAEAVASITDEAPFASWLARYPGSVSGAVYLNGEGSESAANEESWSEVVETALDSGKVHTRAAQADKEASARLAVPREDVDTAKVAGAHDRMPPPLSQH